MLSSKPSLFGKLSYTADTYFMLNRFTLAIKDPVIHLTFLEKRRDKFNSFFVPMCIVISLLVLERLVTHFIKEDPAYGELIVKANLIFWLLLWLVCARFWKDWAPLLAFYPVLTYGIIGNLQMYNWLPA